MYKKNTNYWWKHWDFILGDAIILELSFIIALILRNGFYNPFLEDLNINLAIVIMLSDLCVAFFDEEYRGILRRGYYKEFKKILKHVSIVTVIGAMYLFLIKSSDEFSRAALILFFFISLGTEYIFRAKRKKHLLTSPRDARKQYAMIVITTSKEAKKVLKIIKKELYNERKIVGIIIADSNDYVGRKIEGIEVVCKMEDVIPYIQTKWIDSILVNTVEYEKYIPKSFIETCVNMGITIHRRLVMMEEAIGDQQLDRVGGYYVLTSNLHISTQKQMFYKRLLDLVGGFIGSIVAVVLVLIVGPFIYIKSPGPIIFKQERIGKNGRKFKLYKFRSMYLDAEKRKKDLMKKNEMKGLMFKMEADPRIIGSGKDGTRKGIGWFIRKTSIDEFPQFWNVLKGDMSLVGTRPPTIDEWEQYKEHHRGRMAMKPGITGMWQVSGRNNITDFEEVVALDKTYIQNWDVGQDIKILLKTIGVVFKQEGSK